MKEREEKAQFWALNAASLLGQLTISMVNLALVYYLRYTLEASAAVVGAAASTYTSVYLICCLALGGFYQRFRPYKVVTVSVLGMALSSFLVTRTSSIILVFSFLILYGFFMSMLWPQVEAWITRGAEGSRLNRLTSAFNFSWSFGTGISPYVTAFLVTYSPSAALAGAVVLFVVIALVFQILAAFCLSVRALVPEREYIRTKEKNEEDCGFHRLFGTFRCPEYFPDVCTGRALSDRDDKRFPASTAWTCNLFCFHGAGKSAFLAVQGLVYLSLSGTLRSTRACLLCRQKRFLNCDFLHSFRSSFRTVLQFFHLPQCGRCA